MAIYLGNQEVGFSNMAPLQEVVLRPDAELIKTYSLNRLLVTDDEITFPTYVTSNTVLIEPAVIDTITADYDNYDYFIQQKMLTIPQYSITTLAKGRQEYGFTVSCSQVGRFAASTFSAITGGKTVAAPSFPLTTATVARHIYYSSASALAAYTSVTYGLNQTIQAPTANSTTGVITITAPSVTIRGHTTYFVNTFYNALTECRRQYIIKVYRAPKATSDVKGWSMVSNMNSMINDINNNNFTLR